MTDNKFRVEIEGEYGVSDGTIHLLDGNDELVMWESTEWVEDPSLVYVIANAITRGFTEGADVIRNATWIGTDHGGKVSTCSSCGKAIENDDGTWWHVDSMEMFCEPNNPDLTRQADPINDWRSA